MTLRQLPRLTGTRDHWPLSEGQLADLAETARLRRHIRRAAVATRVAAWIALVYLAIFGIAFLPLLAFAPRGARDPLTGLLALVLVMGGLCLLFFLSHGATLRCRVWAPLTVGIIFSLLVVVLGISLAGNLLIGGGPGGRGFPAEMAIGMTFGMIFIAGLPGVMAVMNFVGLAAIPKFLARPAWTVEALILSKF